MTDKLAPLIVESGQVELIPVDPRLLQGALASALAKAQSSFPAIPRDKEVTVQTKSGGSYKFKYAPLDSILSAVRQPLADNGLALTQTFDEGDLITSLLHKDGGSVSGRITLPNTGDNAQALGSAITYLRRYSIQAILGLATEEDDDGNHASGNDATFGGQTPAAPKPPANGPETEELVDTVKRSGMVRNGTANGYKLEARQGQDGYIIGFRLETDKGGIPQVLIAGPAGDALMVASGGNPAALLDTRITVSGKLYQVKKPGRQGYFRLHVTEWETHDIKYPADEDAGAEPPDNVVLFTETV